VSPILESIGSVKGFGWGALKSSLAFESIATVTVGSGGTPSITFNSIPATYTHLQIRAIAKNSEDANASGYLLVQFNGDTASNYSRHNLYGSGATTFSDGAASTTFINGGYGVPRAGVNAANMFAGYIIDILDYANTNKYKTTRSLGGSDQNNTNTTYISLNSGNWRSTSAVTSITITASVGFNHTQYSSFALYGIKG
jgi:hypothetical protein